MIDQSITSLATSVGTDISVAISDVVLATATFGSAYYLFNRFGVHNSVNLQAIGGYNIIGIAACVGSLRFLGFKVENLHDFYTDLSTCCAIPLWGAAFYNRPVDWITAIPLVGFIVLNATKHKNRDKFYKITSAASILAILFKGLTLRNTREGQLAILGSCLYVGAGIIQGSKNLSPKYKANIIHYFFTIANIAYMLSFLKLLR